MDILRFWWAHYTFSLQTYLGYKADNLQLRWVRGHLFDPTLLSVTSNLAMESSGSDDSDDVIVYVSIGLAALAVVVAVAAVIVIRFHTKKTARCLSQCKK